MVPGASPADLRNLAKAEPKEFGLRTAKLIEDGKLTLGQFCRHIKANRDALDNLPIEMQASEGSGAERTVKMIQSTAFPALTSQLAVKQLNAAYDEEVSVIDDLVTDMESDNKVDFVAGIIQQEAIDIKQVLEGHDFPEIGAGEEIYQINSLRNGRRVTLTEEAIRENKAANFVSRVSALGRIAALIHERQGIRRLCDFDGSATTPKSPYVLNTKAGASLYSTTANTPGTRTPSGTRINSNALVDSSNLDTALTRLRSNKTDLGGPLATPTNRLILLVPQALETIAAKILGSEMEPGVLNELNNWGPRGMHRPRLIATPYLDELSTTAWYLGDFKNQFVRKWKMRLETSVLGTGTQRYHDALIAFQMRAAWDVEFGATDYCRVVQSVAATSAPQA
jgi:hypothetical protein